MINIQYFLRNLNAIILLENFNDKNVYNLQKYSLYGQK